MNEKMFVCGDEAVALAVRQAKPHVIAAYPITPQTIVVERLSDYVEDGSLGSEYLYVESEHSAMSACMGASAVGARAFTATSSQGLLYMAEGLHYTEANKERGTAPDDDRTGWEAERAEAFAEAQTAQTASAEMGWADGRSAGTDPADIVSDLVLLGKRLEQSSPAVINDGTMRPAHIDRKRWKKLQEKRIANGHKEDDHEEEQTWQQTMF